MLHQFNAFNDIEQLQNATLGRSSFSEASFSELLSFLFLINFQIDSVG